MSTKESRIKNDLKSPFSIGRITIITKVTVEEDKNKQRLSGFTLPYTPPTHKSITALGLHRLSYNKSDDSLYISTHLYGVFCEKDVLEIEKVIKPQHISGSYKVGDDDIAYSVNDEYDIYVSNVEPPKDKVFLSTFLKATKLEERYESFLTNEAVYHIVKNMCIDAKLDVSKCKSTIELPIHLTDTTTNQVLISSNIVTVFNIFLMSNDIKEFMPEHSAAMLADLKYGSYMLTALPRIQEKESIDNDNFNKQVEDAFKRINKDQRKVKIFAMLHEQPDTKKEK